jgi:hypothetical protein
MEEKGPDIPGKTVRWHWVPIAMILVSVFLIWGSAILKGPVMGDFEWVLYGAGGLSLLSLLWFKRELGADEIRLEQERKRVDQERERLEKEAGRLREVREVFEKDIDQRAALMRKKESELSQKLMTFHEWMEFPQGVHASDGEDPLFTIADLYQQDQAVLELIRERTEMIFDKVKAKGYQTNGDFQKEMLIHDMLDLSESVARIYNPQSERPLLETSVERLLRTLNRISLQLLVFLEELPLDIKTYNLKKIYETVQTGVRVYDTYKKMDPYLTYFRPVYYVGRFALGSNPVTLGVAWALGELAKTGVQKLSSHLMNRYALKMLHGMIFIVASESAGIFGGDFRRREVNWIYGAELTELIRRFPLSRETLQKGLGEIGRLQLRNEYDRIFLYRCLAAGKSAGPEKFRAKEFLSDRERRVIARDLEHFSREYVHGKVEDLKTWKADVEERLALKLRVDPEACSRRSRQERIVEGIGSLAGYLTDIKQRNVEDLPVMLSETRLLTALDEAGRREIMTRLLAEPPMIFDYPNLEPSDDVLDDYFSDLTELCVRQFPQTGDEAVMAAGIYLRRKDAALKKELDRLYVNFLADSLLPESPERKVKPHAARALLSVLEAGERPCFLYGNVKIQTHKTGPAVKPPGGDLWLMGSSLRLMLLQIPSSEKFQEVPALLWQGSRSGDFRPSAGRIEQRFADDCRITGGMWLRDDTGRQAFESALILSGSNVKSYEGYFQAVSDFCKNAPPLKLEEKDPYNVT